MIYTYLEELSCVTTTSKSWLNYFVKINMNSFVRNLVFIRVFTSLVFFSFSIWDPDSSNLDSHGAR
jgi:hypothetical protein